jgi:hypothetical protein
MFTSITQRSGPSITHKAGQSRQDLLQAKKKKNKGKKQQNTIRKTKKKNPNNTGKKPITCKPKPTSVGGIGGSSRGKAQ